MIFIKKCNNAKIFKPTKNKLMLNISPELEQHYQVVAQQMNKPVSELVNSILTERLEDLLDILAAEKVLKRIDAGLEEIRDWEDVKKELYDVEG